MIGWIILAGFIGLMVIVLMSLHRIVRPSEAHLIVRASGVTGVYSATKKFRTDNAGTSYFLIPEFIPHFGMTITHLDVTIKELNFEQNTVEQDQAEYIISSSTKYRTVDAQKNAESILSGEDLAGQLKDIVQAAVRQVTGKYDIVKARSEREEIATKIQTAIGKDFESWGVELVNFVLIDFKDVENKTVIQDISKRREMEIHSTTRIQNAAKDQAARMKEAEADEKAKEREIERDKVVEERKQEMAQAIAEKEKVAQEKAFEVIKVQTIKQAEITKDAAIVKAEEDKKVAIVKAQQQKEAETILKEQKRLEGEGDKLKAEAIAKGEAAPIREMGNAEAEIILKKLVAEAKGKEDLQKALNKFTPSAINALTAELQIEANKDVGIAGAKALEQSEMKVFSGSDNGGGFDTGKVLAQIGVSNSGLENAMLNKTARPQDLGFTALQLKDMYDEQQKVEQSSNK